VEPTGMMSQRELIVAIPSRRGVFRAACGEVMITTS
jgi:hypothetical protein